MATTYRENPAGIAEMLRSPDMVAAMYQLASKGHERWNDIVSIDTGELIESGYVEAGVRDGAAYGEWGSTAPHGVFYEFGTRYMRARRSLALSIDALAE